MVSSIVAKDLSKADVTFVVEGTNMTDAAVTGIVTGTIKSPAGAVVGTITSALVTIPADPGRNMLGIQPHSEDRRNHILQRRQHFHQ